MSLWHNTFMAKKSSSPRKTKVKVPRKAKVKIPRKVRAKAARYGIAEWYGKDLTTMTPEDRQAAALIAVAQVTSQPVGIAPICPFLSTLIPDSPCHKKGGVCSLQKLASASDGSGVPVPGDKIVATCPSRFIQNVEGNKSLFVWIAEKMLDISNPIVIKETPFLRKTRDANIPVEAKGDMEEEAKEEEKKAGRIDWILANPSTMKSGDLAWCVVETQALYFSGDRMLLEFAAYAAGPSSVLFPLGNRRPDYRSSGPKRLWPQLDVKVPVLRAWGKKVVVVIDSYFFANMHTLIDPSPRAKTDRERRGNAEVVWFIVDFDEHRRLKANRIIYTTLDSSRNALNATEPLSAEDFVQNLKQMIERAPKNKVFKA
jgi:hypothetical protein